ncbi:hypothetical protein [Protaetiibacter larvae]|uniref:Uncharacterized protein n=1 Tax=Protaetiibacter larvae TaxID=2592654 RepID=A0A5C1Y5B7_9MICO|nr:hypothetical protein [Protaetiibacter larvae]QEO08598.1 hypothetical protein FLP23_00265 [Protaetiibacter larvae]
MKWVYLALVGVGGVVLAVVAGFADTVAMLGPRWSAALWAVGPTLAGVAVVLAAFIEPMRRRAARLRREAPGALVVICQRTSDLVHGLPRVRGADPLAGPLPAYLVLKIDVDVEFWSSSARLVSFSRSAVRSVDAGLPETREVPTIVLEVDAASGLPALLSLPVGRSRWELWPERRTHELERLRAEIARRCGVSVTGE